MEQVRDVIPDLLTKTTPPEPSSWRCEVHDCDVPRRVVMCFGNPRTLNDLCPACEESRKQSEAIYLEKEQQRARLERRRQMGVPERYICATLSDFRDETPAQQQIAKQIWTFVEGGWVGSPGLLFLGNVGTAKTLLGAALVNYWLDQHGSRSARFYTTLELVRRVKATWSQDSVETESLAYQRLAGLPLLVIDEIGVQFGSQAENTIFSEVINRRYNALHPTILIGNLTLEECVEVLGERVIDRFRDGGHALAFSWPSQRGMKQPDDLMA